MTTIQTSAEPLPLDPATFNTMHGGRAENTVITERRCGPRRRGLHHVAAEAIHQTRRIEVQRQTEVDASQVPPAA